MMDDCRTLPAISTIYFWVRVPDAVGGAQFVDPNPVNFQDSIMSGACWTGSNYWLAWNFHDPDEWGQIYGLQWDAWTPNWP